ncbi:glycosyl hydrolase family 95 catalytic domain-containing protein [Paenibacillus chibensis]|uniref:glycosyl hydrolase family 95 catalytic domain-containing protein n=1 Tax=Paenibacillus chibensis TaxID=59846 RepID=UPI000FD89225|nr:glycoside hydrolase N-terminal domain-containing protein [Paenibacillus chibensis]MEC0371666.1 glycoside hydrolase N-terminal domain-containing protein [Paenibacillus chibensis]
MNTEHPWKLKLRTPSSWWGAGWREALPTGSGTVGAAVYGAVHRETVMLTHGDLWWQSATPDLPDVSGRLPEMRRLMLEGREAEAEPILVDELRRQGYEPAMAVPLPLCDLTIVSAVNEGFKHYSRELDMQTGEVTVRWKDRGAAFERALFASRPEDMIVMALRGEKRGMLQARLSLGLHDPADVKRPPGRPEAPLPAEAESGSDGVYLWYAARSDDGSDFGAVARVIPAGGRLTAEGNETVISGADEALVLLRMFVHGSREKEWQRLTAELAAEERSYKELLASHVLAHGQLFERTLLDLGAEGRGRSNEELLLEAYQGEAPLAMLEKMWAYGRYLLISSSREGGSPCHLYGLWCGEYRGFWAFNMANENLQMIYWQALSGRMPELLLPVFDYVERLLDDFRLNARHIYGCRGIFIPAPTAPDSGLLKTLAPHIVHWTGAAGWIAQHYYDYYLYTRDREFLRNRALPFLREVALFYEDFFITGEDGQLISCPSNSPENKLGNGTGGPKGTTVNATMDFAIAKEVLSRLVAGAGEEGLYPEEVPVWKELLSRIPGYQLNEDGAVREWMHSPYGDEYHHRHQSHLYPMFPGKEITRDKDPELFQAFLTAVKKRLVVGLKEQTGWSLAHMSNLYARLGEGNLALECLDLLSRSAVMNNFFTLHNDWRNMGIGLSMDWAPFQIDANMGFTAAVQEMLLYSEPGLIRILPALPDRWRRGRAHGLLACGNIEVDVDWNREKEALTVMLKTVSSQRVTLKLPRGAAFSDRDSACRESMAESLVQLTGEGPVCLQADLQAGRPLIMKLKFQQPSF